MAFSKEWESVTINKNIIKGDNFIDKSDRQILDGYDR